MDTGTRLYVPLPLPQCTIPIEHETQKRQHPSQSDQFDTENSAGKVLAREADRKVGSIKRVKPLGTNKTD
ncbi:hypothetical protein N7463_003049 [Penicillium fimorum]|uniref:Uncharacterized protein n=1 Tax=Penicillium fimorum TaxID=1882269 RepID=A0A9X0C919_9EURO|nr:hypothetical protein N7463_003049 [Penicillium fimorum]